MTHVEVHGEIILKPGQGTAFDFSDPELVEVYNQRQDLKDSIEVLRGTAFGWLRLPKMNRRLKVLGKKQLELEIRDFLRSKYHNGSHG
jgi:hypothetical protein